MKLLRVIAPVFLALLFSTLSLAQSTGPDDRRITDPQSISSASNLKARPVPIDDLYFTRSVSDASWSPDGKEILFTTNMAGRPNLWKVSSAGGWPIQLAQSDERQYSGTWSPDGKWIVFQQDTAGNELWDIFAVPSDGGEVVNLTTYSGHPRRVAALVSRWQDHRAELQAEGRDGLRSRTPGLGDPPGPQTDARRNSESFLEFRGLEPRWKNFVCQSG